MNNTERISDLKRRLGNARKRAAYASGRPNWGNRGVRGNSGHGDELYELAMCDIKSLTGILQSLTKRKFKLSDPKQEFRNSFSKLMERRAALSLAAKGDA